MKLLQIIEQIQSEGKLTFSLKEISSKYNSSKQALKLALHRLSYKRRILPVRRGFYLIIPPEYSAKAVLPPGYFIDAMMQAFGREYYVGLLSAAALHGSAHQSPQSYQVVILNPPLRPVRKNNISIEFIVKSRFSVYGLAQRKTGMAMINISTPELTCVDLMLYMKRCGGFPRVCEVLSELLPAVKVRDFSQLINTPIEAAILQRLGWLSEEIFARHDLGKAIAKHLQHRKLNRAMLNPGKKKLNAGFSKKWNLILNDKAEADI